MPPDELPVANTRPEPLERSCLFRVAGRTAELWNPETGDIHPLPTGSRPDGRTGATLRFGPAQSWFVVFRDKPSARIRKGDPEAHEAEGLPLEVHPLELGREPFAVLHAVGGGGDVAGEGEEHAQQSHLLLGQTRLAQPYRPLIRVSRRSSVP